ncbi:sodium/nucleoside cotransporter 2 [Crotalus adamanteus]|uniref:Sodium/nucleoside cotransporter n=1 Tax=Crotalus adamanteus TaxID=8729 RepID=A0AAW1AVM5_CROAD
MRPGLPGQEPPPRTRPRSPPSPDSLPEAPGAVFKPASSAFYLAPAALPDAAGLQEPAAPGGRLSVRDDGRCSSQLRGFPPPFSPSLPPPIPALSLCSGQGTQKKKARVAIPDVAGVQCRGEPAIGRGRWRPVGHVSYSNLGTVIRTGSPEQTSLMKKDTRYLAYFIAACYLDYHRALALIILTSLALAFLAYSIVKKCLGAKIIQMFSPCRKCCEKAWPWLKWVLCAILLIALITWLVLDVSQRKEQLVSLGGFCVLVFLLFLFSKHPMAVSWRAVFWGLGLQFVLGIFIIRTEPGFQAFQWLGNQIQIFLNYTTAGSSFVFGEKLIQESFAFQALPIVIFFSCVMSILYYLGVMQFVILKLSWLLQITMGTAATESLSVVGNIFVGMTEAPLLIRPYLGDMTRSEVHAVMTGGFATIAGSVMGAYISFGIDASSLIAASVMAAPCALAMAKLVYPEVETSKFQSCEGIKIACGEEKNILEAAGNGASVSVGLVANIAANLIAFLAVLAFINAALSWLGGMVNLPQLSFQLICSYVLMPLAFLLGASWEDASLAAEMVGIKFFLNEFVAYQQLSTYKNNRLMGLPEWDGSQKQWISFLT